MRSIRKMVLAGVSALMLCLSLAAGASADVGETLAGHLAVGATVTGTSSTTVGSPTTISGTFFGIAQTMDCDHSALSGVVTQNTVNGQPVTAKIDSIVYTNCKNTQNANVCTFTSNMSSTNPADLTVAGTGAATLNLTSATLTFKNGCFSGQFTDCTFTQVGSGISGTFSNTTSNLTFAPSVANMTSSNCGISYKWSVAYNLTSGGNPVKVTTS